ncbi:MAG: IS66 family insertion sequence element accessory protein TnpA [Burkholderiales bacterium]
MGKQMSPATSARKAQSWHDHIARQANSGKTIAAFCRDEGLSEGNFYFWRNRLRSDRQECACFAASGHGYRLKPD